jgi:DNA polymerase-3 subunit gamma/tau
MSTLYRDYRPNNFSEILGQKHIKVTLQNEISSGHLAQAFLFCGPRAVGKTTMARVLAKSVNCLNRKENEFEPCGKCDNCLDITSGRHLDVIEIDAASNTGVDNVRENIISFSRLVPNKAKYKVFIIDEVHMLSPSAFNALLKIIEEPPAYVMFILCTTEIHKVPQTIISRCERFDFKRIGVSEIVSKLRFIATKEKREIDDEVLEAVARRSGGHLRDAESLLGQVFALNTKKIGLKEAELLMPHYNNNEVIELLNYLANKDTVSALTIVNRLADAGVNLKNFISELIFISRKIAISKISPQLSDGLGLNLGDLLEMKISNLSKTLPLEKLLYFIKRFLVALDDKTQIILQLPLELAVIEICALDNVTGGSTAAPLSQSKDNIKSMVSSTQTIGEIKENKELKNDSNSKSAAEPVKFSSLNISCDKVLEKWPEFLIKIKKYNHSLSFVLQNCEPQDINQGKLRLAFKYKFHQDRVKDENIKGLIENTLKEVFGCSIGFDAELNENLTIQSITLNKEKEIKIDNNVQEESQVAEEIEKKKNESLMNNLLNTFGGEVIS